MQILQWFFKVAQEEHEKKITTINKNKAEVAVEDADSKDLVLFKKRRTENTDESEITTKVVESFAASIRRGNARAIFYDSLNLKRLGSFRNKQQYSVHTFEGKEEGRDMGHQVDLAAHVGNKVLPISDATAISACKITNYQCWSSAKKDELKGDKNRAISRMKELWKWAATAKSDKGGKYIRRKVQHFRNRGTAKDSLQDDQWSLSSPKISFRWETDSCSTTTSAYSAFSLPASSKHDRNWTKPCSNNVAVDVVAPESNTKDAPLVIDDNRESSSRPGSWITTDDEFVVLEL